uniref:Acyltransferase 3 domain-containing protein n=1 Tax=Fervidobacterium thailandense TaxID=1008305 RepID=A0A7C4VU68_9BACT
MGTESRKQQLNVLVLEGFILVLVVMMHTSAPKFVVVPLSYGIPTLFFIRGYQWKERKPWEVIRSRIQLIATYYTAGLIGTTLFVIFSPAKFLSHKRLSYFLNLFVASVSKGDEIAVIVAPIWFLATLFSADVLYAVIKNRLKNGILFSSILLLSILIRPFVTNPLFFRLGSAFLGLPFVELGYRFRKRGLKPNVFWLLGTFVVLLLVSFCNGEVSWYTHDFGNVALAYVGEVAMIIVGVYLGQLLTKSRLKSWLEKIALNALFILPYHGVIGVLLAFLYLPFLESLDMVQVFVSKYWFLHFALTMAVIVLIIDHLPSMVKRVLVGDLRLIRKLLKTGRIIDREDG